MQTVPHTSDDVKIFTHALSQFMAIGKNLTLTQEKIRQHLVKTSSAGMWNGLHAEAVLI